MQTRERGPPSTLADICSLEFVLNSFWGLGLVGSSQFFSLKDCHQLVYTHATNGFISIYLASPPIILIINWKCWFWYSSPLLLMALNMTSINLSMTLGRGVILVGKSVLANLNKTVHSFFNDLL